MEEVMEPVGVSAFLIKCEGEMYHSWWLGQYSLFVCAPTLLLLWECFHRRCCSAASQGAAAAAAAGRCSSQPWECGRRPPCWWSQDGGVLGKLAGTTVHALVGLADRFGLMGAVTPDALV